jgi:hypothetical protein
LELCNCPSLAFSRKRRCGQRLGIGLQIEALLQHLAASQRSEGVGWGESGEGVA